MIRPPNLYESTSSASRERRPPTATIHQFGANKPAGFRRMPESAAFAPSPGPSALAAVQRQPSEGSG
jgi:hypothetical protein